MLDASEGQRATVYATAEAEELEAVYDVVQKLFCVAQSFGSPAAAGQQVCWAKPVHRRGHRMGSACAHKCICYAVRDVILHNCSYRYFNMCYLSHTAGGACAAAHAAPPESRGGDGAGRRRGRGGCSTWLSGFNLEFFLHFHLASSEIRMQRNIDCEAEHRSEANQTEGCCTVSAALHHSAAVLRQRSRQRPWPLPPLSRIPLEHCVS